MTTDRGPVAEVLGDPADFLDHVLAGLAAVGIDTASHPLSHLGFKAPTVAAYERIRDDLLAHADGIVENVHNGRPIAKGSYWPGRCSWTAARWTWSR